MKKCFTLHIKSGTALWLVVEDVGFFLTSAALNCGFDCFFLISGVFLLIPNIFVFKVLIVFFL